MTSLLGEAGKDRVFGQEGDDFVAGGDDNDTVSGGNGDDLVDGDAGKDELYGNAGLDVLFGDSGRDYLEGGAGADVQWGGAGADRFVLRNLTDTGSINADADYIGDFSFAGGDRLDLSRIDANEGRSGNQAFSFIGTASFTRAGQANYSVSGGDTFVALNTDADADAEAVIHIEQLGVNSNWFVL